MQKKPLAPEVILCYTYSQNRNGGIFTIMTHIHSVEALRLQFKKLRRLYFLFMILAVLALAMFFIDSRLTLVFLGASLILNLVLGRRKSKEYIRNFTHLSAQLTLEKHLQEAQHSHEPILTEEDVRSARMLPCNAAKGGVVCHEGGTGVYRDRKVTLGDVTLAHTFTVTDKKRHNFTVGSWITVELEKDTGLDCRFIGENTTPDQSLKEMLWVESDLKQSPVPMALKSKWRVVCQENSLDMPNSNFCKHLDKLHKKADGRLAVSVQGNKLYIMLIGDILAQNVSSRVAPGPQFENADLLPHLSFALVLSDLL